MVERVGGIEPAQFRRKYGIDPPPVQAWPAFYNKKAHQLSQGMHILFIGPTQSGKTLLCREFARLRSPVVVFGTKPVDPTLDSYVSEGYVRIDHWPPTNADYRKGRQVWQPGEARFIIWPQMKRREDLRKYRHVYAKALDEIFIEGHWCIVADEGLWLASRGGLGLAIPLGDTAYGTASNKVSLYLCVQRHANVPPVAWTSVAEAEIFHMGRTEDVRELASLGTYPPRAAIEVVQRGLADPDDEEISHRFLSLPTRGGSRWAISEVELV
jgi:hypothetical protein